MARKSTPGQAVFGSTVRRISRFNAHASQPGDVAAHSGRHDRHRRTKFPETAASVLSAPGVGREATWRSDRAALAVSDAARGDPRLASGIAVSRHFPETCVLHALPDRGRLVVSVL
jgi:hypothetical protein